MTPKVKQKLKSQTRPTKPHPKDPAHRSDPDVPREAQEDTTSCTDSKLAVQQRILDICQASFAELLCPTARQETLEPKVQHLKHHLYHRDFQAAFGDDSLLHTYAARWSPSRALAYGEILEDIYLQHFLSSQPSLFSEQAASRSTLNVACIGGGGGAEYMGLSAVLDCSLHKDVSTAVQKRFAACIVDIADWSPVLQTLYDTRRSLMRSIDVAEDDKIDALMYVTIKDNVLEDNSLQNSPLREKLTESDVITIFFTLNELFNDSRSKTQMFLLRLTELTKSGTILAIVDSPGSYSTISFTEGGNGGLKQSHKNGGHTIESSRQYPMAWLLDHILLKLAPQAYHSESPPWKKLNTCQSRWFRVPKGLKYPIQLENMRYQLHTFRRG